MMPHEVLERFKVQIIVGYHSLPDPKPLDEFCALLIQNGDNGAVILLCRIDCIEACFVENFGLTWPEFTDYAKERMTTQASEGMLRIAMALEIGMAAGRIGVLPGAQA